MTDEPSNSPPSSGATAAGNQNLIIGLILGAVVLLLFLLVVQMTGGGFGKESEVDKLKAERDARKKELNSKLGTTTSGESPQEIANRLSADSATLASLTTRLQAMLAKAQTDLHAANSTVQTLSNQLANTSNSAAENATLKSQLSAAQTRAANAESQLATLQQQLASAPSSAQMEAALKARDDARLAQQSAQQQLAQLVEQMKSMETSEISEALRKQLDTKTKEASTLTTENNTLRYELQKLRAELDKARLFVEADALPAKAKLLYDELTKLDAASPEVLQSEYERINQEVGASVVDKIDFQTNSSRVPFDKAKQIELKLQAAGEESFFLVVGYASKSGDLAVNRQLSADRATRIASVTNLRKKNSQGVQAVFLSETARFGPDLAANQVCEVWEIRK